MDFFFNLNHPNNNYKYMSSRFLQIFTVKLVPGMIITLLSNYFTGEIESTPNFAINV